MPEIEVGELCRQPVGRGQAMTLVGLRKTGNIYRLFNTGADGFRPQVPTAGMTLAIADIDIDTESAVTRIGPHMT